MRFSVQALLCFLRMDANSIIIEMYSYYQKLHCLKGFLLLGESTILFIRLLLQVLFTLPSALLVMQVFMSALMYSRRYCLTESQFYIVINCLLFYFMAYNALFDHYYKTSDPGPIVENFKNDYKVWGYAGQTIFRIIAMCIAWRCYQFSKISNEQSEDEEII